MRTIAQPGDEGADDELGALVERLDSGEAQRLLLDAATRHGDLARTIRLATARPEDRVASLRSGLDALRTRRHLGYRESMEWAHDAGTVVDEITAAAQNAPSREMLKLVELAINRIVKVILHAEDSSGMIGALAHQLLEAHEQICDARVADPKALAKWMVRFGCDDQDFFTVDQVRYSTALGDNGLAALRRAVDDRSARPDPGFAVRYTQERMAVLDGDIDKIVARLGGDLTAPHQFIRVAEAMLELDRNEDALACANRGIESTNGWQVGRRGRPVSDVAGELGAGWDAVMDAVVGYGGPPLHPLPKLVPSLRLPP